MAITVGGTTITFNDATTQTTAPVNTNANVTSVSAGSGISVSSTTGAVVVSATGGGTVTSVATGNGLQGGTITTSGTLSLGNVSNNTVGAYNVVVVLVNQGSTVSAGGTYSAGAGNLQMRSASMQGGNAQNILSGTWRWMASTFAQPAGACDPANHVGLAVRIS